MRRIIGVNQRDLRTFEVDHERALRMAARSLTDVISVAESGVRDAGDAAAARATPATTRFLSARPW